MGCCHDTEQALPRVPKQYQSSISKERRLKDQQIINSRKLESVPTLRLSINGLYSKRTQPLKTSASVTGLTTPTSADLYP